MAINLWTTRRSSGRWRPGPPGRDEHAAADLAQVRPRRARVPQGARHARGDDRRALASPAPPRAPVPPAYAATRSRQDERPARKNGANLASVMSIAEMCWGDVGPAALDAAPGTGQLRDRLGRRTTSSSSGSTGVWAAMAITEPGTGSDSANITTTAVLDGDEYVLNGEKIYVTSGDRADAVVVWATPGPRPGPGGDQVVRGAQGHAGDAGRPARAQARHQGLRHRHDHLRGLPGAEGEPPRLAGRRRQAGLRRRDGHLRQHPPAGGLDGRRLREGGARPDPRAARAGRRRGRLRPPGA